MAATLISQPNEYTFVNDNIIVGLQTDNVDIQYAHFEFVLSGAPTTGQAIELEWDGGGVTFTAGATAAADGRTWPTLLGGETLPNYAIRVLEFFRQYEPLTDVFRPTLEAPAGSNQVLRLTALSPGVLNVAVVSETLANVSVTVSSIATVTTPDNLSALVSVYDASHNLKMKLHGTYDSSNEVQINLSPAFTELAPVLPLASSIAPAVPTWATGIADTHMQEFYFRYSDKYGAPPVSEAQLRSSANYYAMLGGTGVTTLQYPANSVLRHNYVRLDGEEFRKPVSPEQPDWLYWLAIPENLDGPTYRVQVQILWSDGTLSLFNPFGLTERTYTPNKINWVKAGYQQLNLHNAAPPSGTDSEAIIIGYDVRLIQPAGTTIATAYYDVDQLSTPGTTFLLMENGVGGLESVWLHGTPVRSYEATREQWRRLRSFGTTAQVGDIDVLFSEGREVIKQSTGWYEETYYLDHLRQIMHGACWLIDTKHSRFLRVIVENATLESIVESETLHQMQVDIKSAWINSNYVV